MFRVRIKYMILYTIPSYSSKVLPPVLMIFFSYFRVIDGLEVLDDLEKLLVNEKNYRPFDEVKIIGAVIHANPLAE